MTKTITPGAVYWTIVRQQDEDFDSDYRPLAPYRVTAVQSELFTWTFVCTPVEPHEEIRGTVSCVTEDLFDTREQAMAAFVEETRRQADELKRLAADLLADAEAMEALLLANSGPE